MDADDRVDERDEGSQMHYAREIDAQFEAVADAGRQASALVEVHRQGLYAIGSPRGGGLHWTVARNPGPGQPRGHGATLAGALRELLEQESEARVMTRVDAKRAQGRHQVQEADDA